MRWRPQLLPLTVSCLGALAFFLLLVRAAKFDSPIWFDGPIFGIEQSIADARIYSVDALRSPPYSVVTHPPLSYLLTYPLYAAGWGAPGMRLVTVLLILINACLIYRLIQNQGPGSNAAAWFGATVFLIFPPVFRWSLLIRCPDALSCCFDLCIVLLLLRVDRGASREMAIGLLFALAILSKQSCLFTFAPVLLVESYYSRRPFVLSLIRWAACLLPVSLFVFCAQKISGGGFLTNVVNANIMQANLITWIGDVILEMGFFWLLAIVVLKMVKKGPRVIVWWFLVSAAAGVLTDWKDGANSLYFFEASASLAILAGYALRGVMDGDRFTAVRRCAALALPALLILSFSDATAWEMSAPEHARQYEELLNFLRHKHFGSRQVLTQDASVSLALREPVLWNDALVLGALKRQGQWDDSLIVSQLERGQFYAAVGLIDHYWTPAMQASLARHYYQAAVFGGTFAHTVYLPKPQARTR